MERRTYGFSGDESKIEKLHSSRRIFAVIDGKVEVAPEGVPYSHKEWLETLGLRSEEVEEIMENNLRGYVSPDGNVFFYKGYDFNFDEESLGEVSTVIPELRERLDLNKDSQIFGGVQKGEAGKPWPPKAVLGTIKDFGGDEKCV